MMGDKLSAIINNAEGIKSTIGIPTSTSLPGTVDSLTNTKSDLVDELVEKDIEASVEDPLNELVGKVNVLVVSPSVDGTELVFGQGTGAEVEGSELQL